MGDPSPEAIDNAFAAAKARPSVFVAIAILCLGAGFGAATLLTQERVATIEAQRDSAIREIDKLTKSIADIDAQAKALGAELEKVRQAGVAVPSGVAKNPISDVSNKPVQRGVINPPDDGMWKPKTSAPMADGPAPKG